MSKLEPSSLKVFWNSWTTGNKQPQASLSMLTLIAVWSFLGGKKVNRFYKMNYKERFTIYYSRTVPTNNDWLGSKSHVSHTYNLRYFFMHETFVLPPSFYRQNFLCLSAILRSFWTLGFQKPSVVSVDIPVPAGLNMK